MIFISKEKKSMTIKTVRNKSYMKNKYYADKWHIKIINIFVPGTFLNTLTITRFAHYSLYFITIIYYYMNISLAKYNPLFHY